MALVLKSFDIIGLCNFNPRCSEATVDELNEASSWRNYKLYFQSQSQNLKAVSIAIFQPSLKCNLRIIN